MKATISLLFFLFLTSNSYYSQTSREWAVENFIYGVWDAPDNLNDFQDLETSEINVLFFPDCPQYTCNDFNQAQVDNRLSIAAQTSLRLLITDRRHMVFYDDTVLVPPFNDSTAETILAHYRDYLSTSHPTWRNAMLGYHIKSEPDAAWFYNTTQSGFDLSQVRSWMGFLKTNDAEKLAFFNLTSPLAWFDSAHDNRIAQPVRTFTENEKQLYYDYLEDFLYGTINEVPDVVCFDNYIYDNFRFNYFWPLDAIRRYSGDRPFWTTPDIRRNRSELRFTTFCPLAYGAKGVIYYYWDSYHLINSTQWATEINNYIDHIIAPVIFNSEYVGTYHQTDFFDDTTPIPVTLEVIPGENKISTSTPLVQGINGTNENRAMVGIFYDLNSLDAYLLIVNKGYNDAMGTMNCIVTLKGNFHNKVYSSNYATGNGWDLSPIGTFSGGSTTFTVSLPPGQGQLFRVLNADIQILAYLNKTQNATAYNNSRRIVRDASGNYHIVFSSGGEIFYRKSIGGSNWNTPVHLSSSNGNNNHPSITFGGSDNIFVTWQRQTGTSSYNIYVAFSSDGGFTWSTTNNYTLASETSNGPYPVITYSPYNSRKTIAYSTLNGIKVKTTTSILPVLSNWQTQLGTGSSTETSPSIASTGSAGFNIMVFRNTSDGHIHYRSQHFSGSWNADINLSNIIPGQAINQNPIISGMPSAGSVHAAWIRYSYINGYPTNPRVYYRKNTGANSTWPTQYWSVGDNYSSDPSITALTSNKIDVLYTDFQSTRAIYKSRFNGSTWSTPILVAPNSSNPSVSIGQTNAKYLYIDYPGSNPWQITMNSEILNKDNNENTLDYYTRSIAWLDTLGSYVELKLHKLYLQFKDGTQNRIDLIPVPDSLEITMANSWDFLSSLPFMLTQEADKIIFEYSVNANEIEKNLSSSSNNLELLLTIKTDKDIPILYLSKEHFPVSGKLQDEYQQFIIPVNSLKNSQMVKASIRIDKLIANDAAIASLGHIFDFKIVSPDSINDKLNHTINKAEEVVIQNYPNPFNPSTTITYSIPTLSDVELYIYDLMGKEVKSFIINSQSSGNQNIIWDGKNNYGSQVSSGIYIYRFKASSLINGKTYIKSNKLMLIK